MKKKADSLNREKLVNLLLQVDENAGPPIDSFMDKTDDLSSILDSKEIKGMPGFEQKRLEMYDHFIKFIDITHELISLLRFDTGVPSKEDDMGDIDVDSLEEEIEEIENV